MRTAARLSGYVAVLALLFGLAWWTGTASGPATPATPAAAGTGHPHTAVESAGVTATTAGYTFVPAATTFPPGVPGDLAFTITGSDGRPVTAFDVESERRMHLVVVRRDGAGFQHLHPEAGPDGVWRTPLALPAPGVYRAFADFVPTGGPGLVLGVDLFVPGDFAPVDFPPSRVSDAGGYVVRLDGDLVPGGPSELSATISRDGAPVTDLEPYLGAFGHLVVLRRSDLAYLHVHPDAGTARPGPALPFTVDVPTPGGYRLFVGFRHGGGTHTAEFTLTTDGEGAR